MSAMVPISVEELGQAVRDGADVIFGLPVVVHRKDGSIAALDLVKARKGIANPYHIFRDYKNGIREIVSPLERTLLVDDIYVSAHDLGFVDYAIKAAPRKSEMHDPEANNKRLKAGRYAMRVRNTMLRARLLDIVDGWEALKDTGKVIDDDPEHGVLIRPNRRLGINANILIVRCPSTARKYSLLVPRTLSTSKSARLWTLRRKDVPEVET